MLEQVFKSKSVYSHQEQKEKKKEQGKIFMVSINNIVLYGRYVSWSPQRLYERWLPQRGAGLQLISMSDKCREGNQTEGMKAGENTFSATGWQDAECQENLLYECHISSLSHSESVVFVAAPRAKCKCWNRHGILYVSLSNNIVKR